MDTLCGIPSVVSVRNLTSLYSPGPLIPLSTLQAIPRDIACKTRGQDGFAALLSRSRVERWRGAGFE